MRRTLKISAETVELAGETLFGCVNCSSEADTPFERMLDTLLDRDAGSTEYVLSGPAHCPFCHALVSGRTLVEPARILALVS